MTTPVCDVYSNVMNITNYCEVDIMGIEIKTPCVPLCIAALQYAYTYCSYIYGMSNLLEKITALLKKCENPMVKEKIIQYINKRGL